MNELKINHLASIVCIVLLHVLGFLWYGPLFGEPWMEAVGLTMADAEANPPGLGVWLTNTIATIASVYLLAFLLAKMSIKGAVQGLIFGVLIGFVFSLLSNMTGDMFAQNPYYLSWITGGFDTVALGLTGLILGAWKKK